MGVLVATAGVPIWVIDSTLSALNPGWIASMGHAAPEASGPML